MAKAQEVAALRKAGCLDEALAVAKPALAAAPDDIYLRRAVGWLFFDLIKREISTFEERKISRVRLIAHIGEWLEEYARGGKMDCPGLLHSLLLTQVLKVNHEWPRFLAFARWWDPGCLRPEDREPYLLGNGKTAASLELRLLYAVGRAVGSAPEAADTALHAWGVELVDSAITAHPNDQWLHYYKSKRLIAQGRTSEAREHILPIVRRQPRASWAWGLFGRTWEQDDPDKAIVCYFRAIQVAGKDLEVVGTHVRLALLLAKAERYPEAAVQVRTALEFRKENEYRIPQDLARLAAAEWYRRCRAVPSVVKEPDVDEAAEALLHGAEAKDLLYRLGVVDHRNPEKALAHVAFGPDEGAILRFRDMQGASVLTEGACVEVGFIPGETRPVTYRLIPDGAIPDVYEQFEGKLSQRLGQAFAFIIADDRQRIFVPPNLARKLQALVGQRVSCGAVMGKDKEGMPGWRAISVDGSASDGEERVGSGQVQHRQPDYSR